MGFSSRIRVIVVDASGFRSSLLTTLFNGAQRSVELVGEARDLEVALKFTAVTPPDVALVAAEVARKNERAFRKFVEQRSTSVLILAGAEGEREELPILRGASGVVYAGDTADSLLEAIAAVHHGHLWLNRRTAGRVFVALCRGRVEGRRAASR